MKPSYRIAFLAVALLSVAPSAFARPTIYRIDTTAAADLRLGVTLELDEAVAQSAGPIRLTSRAVRLRLRSQIEDVHCDGTAVIADERGWSLPSGCRIASWKVTLIPLSAKDVLASDQESGWHMAGWGLLSEPTSLLRVSTLKDGAEVHILEGDKWRRAADLPPQGSAPAYFTFGNIKARRSGDHTLSLAFVADDLTEVLRQVSPDRHLAALQYLQSIIPPKNRRDLAELKVVWFGVSREKQSLGGASGFDTMLSNYIKRSESPTEDEMVMPQVILLHEQFHQLVTARLPLWANESLAQFYGFKAARHVEKRQRSLDRLWEKCCSKDAMPPLGLVEVQRQVQSGNPSNYDMFYSKGAAFWHALDLKLQSTSGGKRSLDTILPVILSEGFNAEGVPSMALRVALSSIPADDLQGLFDRFLGPN